ncbi:hypothetical protein GC170_00075 [bacterium]|nr:hypothetical protein [bacterium]
MSRSSLGFIAVFSLTVIAVAQDFPPVPNGSGPSTQLARAVEKDGAIVVRFSELRSQTVSYQIVKDGVTIDQQRAVWKWADIPIDVKVDGKVVRVLGADGKPIDPKTLLKRLAKPSPVAVFTIYEGQDIQPDPFYLKMLGKDVLVFAAPYDKLAPPRAPRVSPPPRKKQ